MGRARCCGLAFTAATLAAATSPAAQAASGRMLVELRTVPQVPGVTVVQGGRAYRTDRDGRIRMRVRRLPGVERSPEGFRFATPRVEAKEIRTGVVARFSRFGLSPSPRRLRVGLSIHYGVRPAYIDVRGIPVDPRRIRRFVVKSNLGVRTAGYGAQALELQGIRVGPYGRHGQLEPKPVGWSLESVDVDGSNVVNRGQVRFYPSRVRVVPIKLLFFDVAVASRDALFGMPAGTSIDVRYPDGRVEQRLLDEHGRLSLSRLARGDYHVRVDAGGLGTSQLVSVSRDQVLELNVVSYVDLALGGAGLAGIVGGLLLARRPALRVRMLDRLHPRSLTRSRPAPEGRPSDA